MQIEVKQNAKGYWVVTIVADFDGGRSEVARFESKRAAEREANRLAAHAAAGSLEIRKRTIGGR